MTDYEIACTLSHLKAINIANSLEGNYFMICEDDISFDNISLFKENLEDIITSCPTLDILILYKTFLENIKDTYIKWNDNFVEEPIYHIGGAVCYIISREGINKIINICKYDIDNDLFIFNKDYKLDLSDIFLYRYLNTYVYKYNYISTLMGNSTIHLDHSNIHNVNEQFQKNIILNEYLFTN
jgi:GR25 family glycosyltransferase involved in LPS biosynthesis